MIFLQRTLAIFLLATLAGNTRDAASWIQAENLKARMQFLASEDLEGRNAGSHEGRIAANYIASEFMRLGLKPAGDSDTYFQNFDTVRATIDERKSSLTIKTGGAEKAFMYGSDFSTGWSPQTNNPIEVTAPLVFAGYGINAPEYGYNDLGGIDVRGKIVMIFAREPQASDPNSKFKGKWDTLYSYPWSKADQLQKAGVAGILMIDPSKPQRPPRVESGPPDYMQPGTPSYGQSLTTNLWDTPFFDLTEQAANEILKTAGKNVAELQQSIDQNYRPNSFEISGTSVTMRKAYISRDILHMRNVAGLLEGSDPTLKNETVVISAHYDHGGVIGQRVYPGADDNASGTIGVLEIARAYVRGEIKPRRSILFIVFDAEERGLLGSFYYINHPLAPLDRTAANLNMDMIGRDEETPTWNTTPEQNRNSLNIMGTLYDPGLRAVVENENKTIGLKLDYKTDADDRENWFARSDHYPFATKSIPMILFTTGEHADYHTENDTWNRIDYPKMEKIVRLIFLSSVDVANANERIKFVP
jgi:peptidase M28-like protein